MHFYTHKKRPPVINIVALIDILTILLVFFIVTTTFKKAQPKVQIDLPESSSAKKEQKQREVVIIHVTKDEKIAIGGEESLSIQELPKILRAKKASLREPVFALEADKGVPLGFFVKVLDASKAAGIENLSLHTKEPTQQPAPDEPVAPN